MSRHDPQRTVNPEARGSSPIAPALKNHAAAGSASRDRAPAGRASQCVHTLPSWRTVLGQRQYGLPSNRPWTVEAPVAGDGAAPKVLVGVVGPSFGAIYETETPGFESPPFLDQGPEVPWAERLKTEVPIGEDTTLEQVINRAALTFGIRTSIATGLDQPQGVAQTINGIGFWTSGDDAQGVRYQHMHYFFGVDPAGHAVWGDV